MMDARTENQQQKPAASTAADPAAMTLHEGSAPH